MIDKESIEQFLDKEVSFSWLLNDKTVISKGKIIKVTDRTVTVMHKDQLQVYSLDSLISIREYDENNKA